MKKNLSPLQMALVVIAGLLIISIMAASLQGCAVTKWAVAPAQTIQAPEKRPIVRVVIWKVQDPVTKQESIVIVIPKDQLFLVGASFKIDDRFIKQCLDLIGPKREK